MAGQSRLLEQTIEHARSGRLDDAVAACRRAVRLDPKSAQAFDLLAQLLELQDQPEAAIEALRSVLRLSPGAFEARKRLAGLLASSGQAAQSVEVWREEAERTSYSAAPLVMLAQQLRAVRRGEEAVQVAEDAAARFPADPFARLEAARACERLGRMNDARRHADLVGPPLNSSAEYHVLWSNLEIAAGRTDDARRRLETAAQTPQGQATPIVCIALAQLLDRAGEFDAAFAWAERGRGIASRVRGLEAATESHTRSIITQTLAFSKAEVASWPAMAKAPGGSELPPGVPAAPVFVVGFPRSGTTLFEQMLGAHPKLVVTDEQPLLRLTWRRLFRRFLPGAAYPRDLARVTPEQAAQARRWYFDLAYSNLPHAASADGAARRRIVDKQPYNTAELLFVRMIFPDSPVICMQRDPRDTLLSVMLQAFGRAVPELYTLEGAAGLYDGFARVWEHCREITGLRTAELRYEDLVTDPETHARRMVEFIGEEWQDSVLNYHRPEHRRYVATPSYGDVATPVYRRAIGRWKHYRQHLESALPMLKPWVREE